MSVCKRATGGLFQISVNDSLISYTMVVDPTDG